MTRPRCSGTGPEFARLQPGTYSICWCGKSAEGIFCDGSHAGSGVEPKELVVEKLRNFAICRCDLSTHGALCDGKHRQL